MNEVVQEKRSKERSESCPSQVHPRFFSLVYTLTSSRQHPAMINGVKTLKAAAKPQTTFLCLSSSNSVFISTILEVRDGSSSSVSL